MIRKFVLMKIIAASWVAAMGNLAEAAAHAALFSTVTVRYDPVELQNTKDIARIYRRLQEAAAGHASRCPSSIFGPRPLGADAAVTRSRPRSGR